MPITVDPNLVRAALDTWLTADDLPDATIMLPLYAGAAVREVQARDADADLRTGTARERLHVAAALLTAARLVVAVPFVTAETHGQDSYTRQTLTPEDRAAVLRATAEDEIAGVIDVATVVVIDLPFFRLGTGGRGRA